MRKLAVFVKVDKVGCRARLDGDTVLVEEQDGKGAWHEVGKGRWSRHDRIEGVTASHAVLHALTEALRREIDAADASDARRRLPWR